MNRDSANAPAIIIPAMVPIERKRYPGPKTGIGKEGWAGVSPGPRGGNPGGVESLRRGIIRLPLEHSKVVCVKLYEKVAMTKVGFQSQAATRMRPFFCFFKKSISA